MEAFKKGSSRPRSSSQGTITDLLKRKRGTEDTDKNPCGEVDEWKAFANSKKVIRSPTKTETNMEELMKSLLEKISELQTDIKEVKSSNQEIKADLRKREEEWIKDKEEMKQQIDCLTVQVNEMKEKHNRIERQERRLNVIVTGELGSGSNVQSKFEDFCKNKLDVNLKAVTAREIAKNVKGEPIALIKLNCLNEKIKLMKEKRKLKTQGIKVFIEDDLSKEDRTVQKSIRTWAQDERKKGRKIQIGFMKVKVDNGDWKNWNEIKHSTQ